MYGSGHSETPRTDRYVFSSVGSLAFVQGKDGWLLLMIFSLTKNIIHRTQICEGSERKRWWMGPPHRRKNLDQSKSRNSFLYRRRFNLRICYLELHPVSAVISNIHVQRSAKFLFPGYENFLPGVARTQFCPSLTRKSCIYIK